MTTSVIIPSLNEAESIKQLIDEIPRDYVDEIIVVDGNSMDGTGKVVGNFKDVILLHQATKGFGSAIREGINYAKGDVVVILNADGSHNPAEIPKLLEKINEGYDYVMAERYSETAHSEDDTWFRRFGNKLITATVNIVHGSQLKDSLYLFTAIRKKSLGNLNLKSDGFEFCIEIVVKAYKYKLKLAEVPSLERKRIAGKSKVKPIIHGFIIMKEVLKAINYRH